MAVGSISRPQPWLGCRYSLRVIGNQLGGWSPSAEMPERTGGAGMGSCAFSMCWGSTPYSASDTRLNEGPNWTELRLLDKRRGL